LVPAVVQHALASGATVIASLARGHDWPFNASTSHAPITAIGVAWMSAL
jgi:hypothetical protein